MTIKFAPFLPIAETMVFEESFEESLRLDAEDKIPILATGVAAWLFVDGVLAGETYGISPRALMIVADDEIEDCDPSDDSSVYCYSTAILPAFRGRGLAKLLKAYWLGRVSERGFRRVVGHSTSPEMMTINRAFGCHEITEHANWYETDRTAIFYEIPIDNRSTVGQSAGDCGPASLEYLFRATGRQSMGREAMAEVGKWTDADGISHDGLIKIIEGHGLTCTERADPISATPLLSILNYQWEGDGHYGVLVKKDQHKVYIYNSAFGRIDEYPIADFDALFYSERYPPRRWSLTIG